MKPPAEFWDALAPHHEAIENSYLDAPSVRRIRARIQSPVLVVGAGQGLIVSELQQQGFKCDGVDLSSEMIRYARLRRGLRLIQADARALPFGTGAWRTIIYATGVVDFMSDEPMIRVIMNEGRRIVDPSGIICVAFYRMSAVTERLLGRLGLLQQHVLRFREILEIYRHTPIESITWVSQRAKVGYARAAILTLYAWACSTWQEKRNAFCMQRMLADPNQAETLIRAAPEQQPYRNEAEIRNLLARLGIPIRQFGSFRSCFMVEL